MTVSAEHGMPCSADVIYGQLMPDHVEQSTDRPSATLAISQKRHFA